MIRYFDHAQIQDAVVSFMLGSICFWVFVLFCLMVADRFLFGPKQARSANFGHFRARRRKFYSVRRK